MNPLFKLLNVGSPMDEYEEEESQFYNPYDDGTLWTKSTQNRKSNKVSTGIDILDTFVNKQPDKAPKTDLDNPRNQMTYYSRQLNDMGADIPTPEVYEKANSKGSTFLGGALKGLAKGGLKALEIATSPISAISNSISGFADKWMEETGNKANREDNNALKMLMATPEIAGKSLIAGLKSGGSSLFSPYSKKYKENVTDFSDALINASEHSNKGISDFGNYMIDHPLGIPTVQGFRESLKKDFNISDDMAKQIGAGTNDLLLNILLSPKMDIEDAGKSLKYIRNVDKYDELSKVASTQNASKVLQTDNIKLAKELADETLSKLGGMPNFKGLRVGSKTILSAEDLADIANKGGIQKYLTEASLGILSPLSVPFNNPIADKIGSKIANSELGGALINQFNKNIRFGKNADLINDMRNNPDDSLKIMNEINKRKDADYNKIENMLKAINETKEQITNNPLDNPNKITNVLENPKTTKVKLEEEVRQILNPDYIKEAFNFTNKEIVDLQNKQQAGMKYYEKLINKAEKLGYMPEDIAKMKLDYMSIQDNYKRLMSIPNLKTLSVNEQLKNLIPGEEVDKLISSLNNDVFNVGFKNKAEDITNMLIKNGYNTTDANNYSLAIVKSVDAVEDQMKKHNKELANYLTSINKEDLSKLINGTANAVDIPDFLKNTKALSKEGVVMPDMADKAKRFSDRDKYLNDVIYENLNKLGINITEPHKNMFNSMSAEDLIKHNQLLKSKEKFQNKSLSNADNYLRMLKDNDSLYLSGNRTYDETNSALALLDIANRRNAGEEITHTINKDGNIIPISNKMLTESATTPNKAIDKEKLASELISTFPNSKAFKNADDLTVKRVMKDLDNMTPQELDYLSKHISNRKEVPVTELGGSVVSSKAEKKFIKENKFKNGNNVADSNISITGENRDKWGDTFQKTTVMQNGDVVKERWHNYADEVAVDLDEKLAKSNVALFGEQEKTDYAVMKSISDIMKGEGTLVDKSKSLKQTLDNESYDNVEKIANYFSKKYGTDLDVSKYNKKQLINYIDDSYGHSHVINALKEGASKGEYNVQKSLSGLSDNKLKSYLIDKLEMSGKMNENSLNQIKHWTRDRLELGVTRTNMKIRLDNAKQIDSRFIKTIENTMNKAKSVNPNALENVAKIGLNKKPISEWTNVDMDIFYKALNLDSNLAKIKNVYPNTYNNITKNIESLINNKNYLDYGLVKYIDDTANKIPNTPLNKLLKNEDNVLSKLADKGEQSYYVFKTPKGLVKLEDTVNPEDLSKISIDFDELNGVATNATRYYSKDIGAEGLQQGENVIVDTLGDVKNIEKHELGHIAMENAGKEGNLYARQTIRDLKKLPEDKQTQLVDLINNNNIGKTTKELISEGSINEYVGGFKELNRSSYNSEGFATMTQLFTSSDKAVKETAINLVGEKNHKRWLDVVAETPMKDLEVSLKNSRADFTEETMTKLSDMKNIIKAVENNNKVEERLAKLYDTLDKPVVNDMVDNVISIDRGSYIKHFEENAPKDVVDNAEKMYGKFKEIKSTIEKYYDIDNTKTLSESEKGFFDKMKSEFKDMAIKEKIYNEEDADLFSTYVTHLLTPEAKRDKTVTKFLKDKGMDINDPFNVFTKQRTLKGTISDINKSAENEIGRKIFEENIYKIYLQRKLYHENYMYNLDKTDRMFESFGHKILDGISIKNVKSSDMEKILKELNVDYDLGDYRNIAENALSDFVSKVDKDSINVKDISNVYDEVLKGLKSDLRKEFLQSDKPMLKVSGNRLLTKDDAVKLKVDLDSFITEKIQKQQQMLNSYKANPNMFKKSFYKKIEDLKSQISSPSTSQELKDKLSDELVKLEKRGEYTVEQLRSDLADLIEAKKNIGTKVDDIITKHENTAERIKTNKLKEVYYNHVYNDAIKSGDYVIVARNKKQEKISAGTSTYDMIDAIDKSKGGYDIDTVSKDIKSALNSLDKPYTVINPKNIKPETFLKESNDGVYLLPRYVYENYEKEANKINKKDSNAFIKIFDKVTSIFKAGAVTSIDFHKNNALGNVINSYLLGGVNLVNPKKVKQAIDIASGKTGKVGKYSYEELTDYMMRNGVLENQIANEFKQSNVNKYISGEVDKLFSKEPKAKKILKSLNPLDAENFGLYKANRTIGDKIENNAKIINFITHVENGMSLKEASELTKKALFDYSDVTDFERNVLKRIVPFYTFMRKNVTAHVNELMNSPAKYFIMKNTYDNASKLEDKKSRGLKPEYLDDKIPIGGNKYLNVNNPVEDLAKIVNPKDMLSSLNPLIKLGIELPTNKQLYSGYSIDEYGDKNEKLKYALTSLMPLLNRADKMKKSYDANGNLVDATKSYVGDKFVKSFDVNKAEKQTMYDYLKQLQDEYYKNLRDNPGLKEELEAKKQIEKEMKKNKNKKNLGSNPLYNYLK